MKRRTLAALFLPRFFGRCAAAAPAGYDTPFKYGKLVLEASKDPAAFDSRAVDCPFVFHHDGRFYMAYIGYDGTGYQTGLASSSNLTDWERLGCILRRDPNSPIIRYNVAMNWIVRENSLRSAGKLKKVRGRFLGVYHAYPNPGYEEGPAVIGLCWSDDLLHWELGDICLRPEDGGDWERGGLYKPCLVEHGGVFYLFYNAKTQRLPQTQGGGWREQTGVATSTDLKRWKRYEGNPIIPNGPAGSPDERFASDPCVLLDGRNWVMFYYGLDARGRARDLLAVGEDPFHPKKVDKILIDVGPPGTVDSTYAHKPSVVYSDDALYHFYCAVSGKYPNEARGISVARSRPWPVATGFTTDFGVTGLRCEYVSEPLGVDVAAPRLFWRIESSSRGQRQSAYRVLAASSENNLARDQGDLWDSGKVESAETIQVAYGGRALQSSQRVFWKVRAWDRDGKESAWSRPASWTMGLLSEADWQARWIAAREASETLLLRREFTVKPGLKRAIAHVCGLGHYELSVNGRKVGDDLLAPGWTKYDKTCLYDTRDLTPLVREGSNAVGLFLANGMYNVKGGRYIKFKGSFGPLKAIVQLRLEYAGGKTEIIDSGDEWRTNPGPITFSCVFGGEDHDARLEQRGWDKPVFDDSRWQAAQVVNGPGGKLRGLSAAAPPIKTFDRLKPVSVKPLATGVAVYDLGQNAALIPRVTVKGPAGAAVKIVPAELLQEDGSVDRLSSGRGEAYWKYTLAGGGPETWFPRFFYHGARYLQVERSAAEAGGELPVVEAIEGVVVHSASAPVGEFACSSELFNRIHGLVRWAQRSNMVSVLTDCPHRERLGWLEEYHLNGPSFRYQFDLAQLFRKGMSDMADSQLENGLVPDIAPEYTVFKDGFRDSPEWGSAYVIVPWQQYEWTGDMELLRRHYGGMKRYVAYLGTMATGHILSHGLGDWYDIGPDRPGVAQLTPVALTATAFYYYDARILARAAALLGEAEDAERYESLAARIREAFNRKFFDQANGRYATGSQCANSIPLVMELVEPDRRAAVLEAVVRDVRQRGNALTAGDVGYRYLLRALAEGGRSDVIFDMNHQSEKPGYGYQLKMGATSLTEAWNADRRSSQNHFMLGQIMEWFYHDVAGIGADPAGPGFGKIVIKPEPAGDLTWARAGFDSIRGKIVSHWTTAGGVFTLAVTIPPNTSATVFVPATSAEQVREGGTAATRRPEVKFLRQEKERAVFEIPSGQWEFQSPIPGQ